jgi:hypothetical protein
MELDRYAIGMARLANAIIASVRKDGALSQKPKVMRVALSDGGQKSNGASSLVHQEKDAILCMRVHCSVSA